MAIKIQFTAKSDGGGSGYYDYPDTDTTEKPREKPSTTQPEVHW